MPYPDSEETQAWKAILETLGTDPVIGGRGGPGGSPGSGPMTIRTLADGDPKIPSVSTQQGQITVEQYPDPDAGELPCLRLSILNFAARRIHENEHEIIMAIGFELFVLGTNESGLMNAAGVLRKALMPTDPTRKAAVNAIFDALPFFRRGRMDRQIGAVTAVGQSAHGLKGEGQFSVTLHVLTS